MSSMLHFPPSFFLPVGSQPNKQSPQSTLNCVRVTMDPKIHSCFLMSCRHSCFKMPQHLNLLLQVSCQFLNRPFSRCSFTVAQSSLDLIQSASMHPFSPSTISFSSNCCFEFSLKMVVSCFAPRCGPQIHTVLPECMANGHLMLQCCSLELG